MADTIYWFDPTPALNPDTGELLSRGTDGIVYGSEADAQAGTNPLPLTDSSGVARSSTVSVNSVGLREGFGSTLMRVWWVSSDIIQPLVSDQVAIANVGAQAAAEAAQASAASSAADAKKARDSANNSAKAAQEAADNALLPAQDAIDDYLVPDGSSDTAEGLVGRVAELEADSGSSGSVGAYAMVEKNGQLPIAWDSNMTPTYGTGTPMRPTDSRAIQVPWLLTTIDKNAVPIIDSGTGGFMRGVDIMQVPAS